MEEPTPFPIDEIWLPEQDNPLKITTLPIISSSELQKLDRAREKAAAQLTEFTSDPNFLFAGKLAFGNRWQPERGLELIQEILVGNSPLKIGYIEGGAKWWQGAYSQERETIYLSADWLRDKLAYPAGITTVILEEIGHYLDAHLGDGDALGDEGAIFASLVQCRTQDLEAWRKEDDWGTLTIGGATVAVEYSAPDSVVRNILLQEKSNFSSSHSTSVVIPEEPSVLTFNYNRTFDRTDENGINDAFEVALVGENGDSLVHTIAAGRDAFVNVTEGEGVAKASGVSTDSGTVTLDLSGIPPSSKANLIFRLVNNDGDTETRVTVSSYQLSVSSPAHAKPGLSRQLPRTMGLSVTKSTGMINEDWSLIEDVSGSLQAVYGRTSWEEALDVLYVDAQIVNEGGYEVRNNLLVAVTGISDPGVRVRDFDGVTPNGLPYYNYSKVWRMGFWLPERRREGGLLLSKTLRGYHLVMNWCSWEN